MNIEHSDILNFTINLPKIKLLIFIYVINYFLINTL